MSPKDKKIRFFAGWRERWERYAFSDDYPRKDSDELRVAELRVAELKIAASRVDRLENDKIRDDESKIVELRVAELRVAELKFDELKITASKISELKNDELKILTSRVDELKNIEYGVDKLRIAELIVAKSRVDELKFNSSTLDALNVDASRVDELKNIEYGVDKLRIAELIVAKSRVDELKNAELRVAELKIKVKKINVEHSLVNKLFYIGLVVEALAISYNLATINISKDDSIPKPFYEEFGVFQIIVYLVVLICLLIHQMFIRNSLLKVNEITESNDSNERDFFPNNLMNSKPERFLRQAYFVFLAIIAGEIPYILMTVEKMVNKQFFEDSHEYLVYSFSTYGFIGACFLLCLIVLCWDFFTFMGSCKKQNEKSINLIMISCGFFIYSDGLSLIIWFIILGFIKTKEVAIFENGVLIFALVYSGLILRRLFSFNKDHFISINKNPLKGQF